MEKDKKAREGGRLETGGGDKSEEATEQAASKKEYKGAGEERKDTSEDPAYQREEREEREEREGWEGRQEAGDTNKCGREGRKQTTAAIQ